MCLETEILDPNTYPKAHTKCQSSCCLNAEIEIFHKIGQVWRMETACFYKIWIIFFYCSFIRNIPQKRTLYGTLCCLRMIHPSRPSFDSFFIILVLMIFSTCASLLSLWVVGLNGSRGRRQNAPNIRFHIVHCLLDAVTWFLFSWGLLLFLTGIKVFLNERLFLSLTTFRNSVFGPHLLAIGTLTILQHITGIKHP